MHALNNIIPRSGRIVNIFAASKSRGWPIASRSIFINIDRLAIDQPRGLWLSPNANVDPGWSIHRIRKRFAKFWG